jgi:hypothetical protein
MGWCRVNYIGLIGVVGVGFCFYQSGMLFYGSTGFFQSTRVL